MIPKGGQSTPTPKAKDRRDDRRRTSRPSPTTRVSRWGDQNDNPLNGHQQSPPSPFPDFDDVGELPDGVSQADEIKEDEIVASPNT